MRDLWDIAGQLYAWGSDPHNETLLETIETLLKIGVLAGGTVYVLYKRISYKRSGKPTARMGVPAWAVAVLAATAALAVVIYAAMKVLEGQNPEHQERPPPMPPRPDPPPQDTLLTRDQERALKGGNAFRECMDCPQMVVVPAGSFTMGSPAGEKERNSDEGPQHVVTIRQPFAVGRFHVTRDQFAAFVRETGHAASTNCYKWPSGQDGSWRDPGFAQEGSHPVVCMSWTDVQAYVAWLARKTGRPYRLLSEAEFEYAARGQTSAGSYPRFWFGDDESDLCRYGNGADQKMRDDIKTVTGGAACNDVHAYTSPVGSYRPNAFGLYDMAGNAWQWTEDCYHDSYNGAPSDGSAWAGGCASARVLRGGSWNSRPRILRAASRNWNSGMVDSIGFRLARTLEAN